MRGVVSLAACLWLVAVTPAAPCTILIDLHPSATELVDRSDVIVLAVARDFISNEDAAGPSARVVIDPMGGRVKFDVIETLKGQLGVKQPSLMIQGRLTDRDDFNETPVQKNWPRPGARGGECFATNYRRGATYLLLFKKSATLSGALSLYWSPLSRVNDQVDPGNDEWLTWVREHLR